MSISPLARVSVDPALARFVGNALLAFRGAHVQAGREHEVPAGVDELVALARGVVDSRRQLRPLGATSGEGRRGGYLLPIADAADVAGVCVRTLRRRIGEGVLKDVRVGKRQFIDPLELLRWLDGRAE